MVGTSAFKAEVGGSSPVLVLAIFLFIHFFLFFSVVILHLVAKQIIINFGKY